MGSVEIPSGDGTGKVTEEFLRSAIDKSNLNALRLALLQVTGDPELAKMRTRRHAVRGGAMYTHVLAEEDAPALKEKAFAYLSKRKPGDPIPPPPTREETRKLVDVFGDQLIDDREFEYDFEELAFTEFPRSAEWTDKKPTEDKIAKFKVIVIGGGISGIAAAVQLKRLGINFQVLERQHDIGGTWLLNTYPDARVDVSSFLFQFKFVKNYHWSEYFATAGETQKYLAYVAEKYKVKDHFFFNREVVSCVWHEDESEWELTIKHANGDSETVRCNAVISGTGLFATPNLPDIKGIKDFEGSIFHTAKWDHKVDYLNKDVALLGTGSTGTQLASAVAEKAKSLTVYQRTPNWIMNMEGYRAKIDNAVRYVFDNMPYYWNWFCYSAHATTQQLQYLQNYDKEWQAKGGIINERNDLVRKALVNYITQKSEGIPGLKEKITPHYAPLVRRLVVDNGFYDTLRRDNVELVTENIDTFTKTGIKTKDGVERPFDVVVLGTGFKTSQYFWPCKYVGRNGATMEELWKKDGPRSYLGMTMPGFPNFFILYGPNHQPRSGAFYSWGEIWMRYISQMIIHLIENDKKSIDCRKDVFDDYNAKLDEACKELIWESEGSSYYVNELGRQSVNAPWHTADYHRMVIEPNFEDFDIR
ncbi:putative fad dependent oxidoreductase protein [Phaeoacremonium minimum UCRPA7]|uniref:Putative fad dependent oxidoreductase protein n=1 Tax=Phaeoacremonium minimum (strain UCR-PA7) TaxID=1286976 RepID=R8BGH7_PHAM7|nr:putative fad dependent oxidoreductase protein [Phaeoacremonium minimum UCRPA7]EON98421.1 putative fad dependent oxidoreductase protein [Phaeoacremonium minimum UCRPA7]